MVTRIALFILTNLAVLLVASLVLRLLGVDRFVMDAAGEYALNYTGLFIFSAVFGFGGAFISLFLSKWMAKRATPHAGYRCSIQPDRNLAAGHYPAVSQERRDRHA